MSGLEVADVLVVGGGPAGSTAAFRLKQLGFRVLLVDRARFPREKVCGESLSPGAIARLAAIGMWRPTFTEGSQAQAIAGMQIRSPSGTTFSGRYRAANGVPPGLAIRRIQFDAELLRRAECEGVRCLEGVEATDAEPSTDGGIIVTARTSGAAALRLSARRVVVADGRRSFLARKFGFIEAHERGAHGTRRYAVRAHFENVSNLSHFAEMQVAAGGYCGIAPLSATSANICYVLFRRSLDMSPRTLEADFRRDLEMFPDVARRLAYARPASPIRVIGPLRLHSRRHRAGPLIACGDATGFLDPFTGEGIAHAIATGVLGAERIAASLAGDSSALRSYDRDVRRLRRVKTAAALFLYGLVSRRRLADAAATVFSRAPKLADAAVRLFGDQV